MKQSTKTISFGEKHQFTHLKFIMHWLFELSMFVNILGTNIVAALGEKIH